MVNVKFTRKHDRLESFEIDGHADYAEHGEDIVCSAVSAIGITMANGITEILKLKAACEARDGFLSLSLSYLNDVEIESAQVLMKTMLISFESMKVNYGDYISVTIEEV